MAGGVVRCTVREARPLAIGILPDPTRAEAWPDIEALLRPAAARNGGRIPLAGRQVWTVYDWHRIVGAATTRLTLDGVAEVELVGGTDFRTWLKPLDDRIAAWAAREGMASVMALGRRGWARVLGWDVVGGGDGLLIYERKL